MTYDERDEWDGLRRERARAYLVDIRSLKIRADGMANVVAELEDAAEGVKAVDYSRPSVSSPAYGDAVPDAVAAIMAAKAKHVERLAQWAERVDEAEGLLSRMEHKDLASVLERHYLLGHTVERIAYELDYSVRAVDYKIAEGCIELYDLLPAEYRIPRHPAM